MKIVNGIKMFSTSELCELLGVTGRTITLMRQKGLLPSTQMGRCIYTSEQVLSDYLNGKTTELRNEKKKRAEAEAKAKAKTEEGEEENR